MRQKIRIFFEIDLIAEVSAGPILELRRKSNKIRGILE